MTWSPSQRLLALGGLWTGAALLALRLALPGTLLAAGLALVVAAGALDWLLGRREPALRATRSLPARVYRGETFESRIRLENPARRAVAVRLLEAPPRPVEGSARASLVLAAGEARDWTCRLHPLRRGDLGFGRALVFTASPLGLLRRRIPVAGDAMLHVNPPARLLLAQSALDPRRLFEILGGKPAPRRGEGLEFESLRDYVPGDDPRRLDWAASARRGRPIVRCNQHERNQHVVVCVDTSRLMAARTAGRTKLDHAVDAALVLGYAGLLSGDRVALASFDRELTGYLPPRSRRRNLGAVLDFLRALETRPVEADFRALARALAARQRQRSLLVILTDFVEIDAALVAAAMGPLARRHRVLYVAVRDPVLREIDPRAPATGNDSDSLLRRIVLGDIVRDRECGLLALRRRGVEALDLPPERLTARVLNRYLALRCEV